MSFFEQLKERRVFRTAAIYTVAAWAVIQAVDIIGPRLGAPDWLVTLVIVLAIVGLPIAVVLSWLFDLKREQSRAVGFVLVGMIIALVAFGTYWRVEPHNSTNKADLNSVAVLPFVDMSASKDQEYLGDGITEEILNVLTQLPNLRVPARTSSFAFKGKEIPVSQIAQQLNVANVLEGSVRKAGNRVRITAQLIDARNDKHLWSETYDRDLSDVFAIQDEIAHSIVEALRLQISGTLVENETSNGLAHELYLKGLYFWNRRHAKELPQALEQFIAASREDPKYARAYAGMALTYAILPQYMEYDAAKASRLGKEAAGRALQLDPRAADAHAALCQIAAEMDHDWKGALRHCDEALKLDPQSATAHQWKGEVLGVLGQTDAGLQEFDRAIELDPLSVTAMNGRGILLFRSGRVEEAITVYKELTQRDPDYGAGRANLIISLFVGQHFDEAIRAAGSDSAIVQVIEGMKTPSLKPRAIHILSERSGKAQGYVAGFAVAFNALGQPDSAAAFLDRTADHWTPSIAYAAYDVGYEKMKPYPAYHEFLRKVHLE